VFDPFGCAIYINVRDRLEDLRHLIDWLERAGYHRIVLLDQASTYPPLLEYLAASPHEVVRFGHNWGARVPWVADTWKRPLGEWYVYTDCDLLPIDDCPPDLVAHLYELLGRFPAAPKAGPGLFLPDVPWQSEKHRRWECEELLAREIAPGVFDSLIDTTFALYRPSSDFLLQAIRCGFPYQMRHMPWYRPRLAGLAEDDAYYLAHANGDLRSYEGTTWEPK
jgi:hypothetical protein